MRWGSTPRWPPPDVESAESGVLVTAAEGAEGDVPAAGVEPPPLAAVAPTPTTSSAPRPVRILCRTNQLRLGGEGGVGAGGFQFPGSGPPPWPGGFPWPHEDWSPFEGGYWSDMVGLPLGR